MKEGKKMKIENIGLELYSVKEDYAKDLLKTLEKVKNIGYKGVEFFGEFIYSAEEVSDALNKTGLVCCGWHTPWSYIQDDKLEQTIVYNKKIKNPYIIIPGIPKSLTKTKDDWINIAKKFNQLSDILEKHGMQTGYHNHFQEFIPYEDGTIPYYNFFDNTNQKVIVQLDNGNALKGNGKIYEIPERYSNRMETVHLKPYSFKDGFDTMIGNDDIDLVKFVSLCKEKGNAKWFIVEYESMKLYEPMEGISLCYDKLMELGLI